MQAPVRSGPRCGYSVFVFFSAAIRASFRAFAEACVYQSPDHSGSLSLMYTT